jgi:trimethylamine:corrinoid methyltransferase-like protein
MARLAERGTWESWEAGDRKGMAERAQAEAESLLREHSVPPLREDQEAELDAILDQASRELK